MATTRIDLGKQGVLVVTCLRPYVRQAGVAHHWTARGLLEEFNEQARRVKGPEQPLTGEAFGIAQRLAGRYTHEQMQQLARIFWLRYSDPVYNEPGTHVLRYFLSILTTVERNLNLDE